MVKHMIVWTLKDEYSAEEKVEINVSEESTATKNNAEEIDEVAIYQRADGSVIIVHTHTKQVRK